MKGIWLAGITALAVVNGTAMAQMATTTTTETREGVVAPAAPSTEVTTHERTVDSDGVTTDHRKSVTTGSEVSPYGQVTTTRRTSESTTSR